MRIYDLIKYIRELSPKECQIICMRVGITLTPSKTLEEVGKHFGVTRERIRQIEAKVEEIIRQKMKEN